MATLTQSMAGKTVLITGASRGIGRHTALGLAAMGATLVLVVRDPKKGEVVGREIAQKTGNNQVSLLTAELSSQASIAALAAAFKTYFSRLEVLINNAGAINQTRRLTAEGLEATFATNHLGYFLLSHLLLDRLQASAPARIVNVASAAHWKGTIQFDDLHGEKSYSPWQAYCQSKLANVLFTRALARRLQGTGVTVNAVHPGLVATNFGRGEPGLIRLFVKLATPFMLSAEQGADTVIYLASSPEVEGVTGRYFARRAEQAISTVAQDDTIAERLWEASWQLANLGGSPTLL